MNEIEKSNLIYKFTCPFTHSDHKDHQYIGMTTTTLKRRLNSHKYNGGIKQHLLDHHKTKITSNLLEENTNILDKDVDRKHLYIREALIINKFKPAINTQYNNFSSILQLHSNIQTNFQKSPRRKQDIETNQNTRVSHQIIENSEASSSHLSSYHLPAQERQHQRNIGLLTPIDELSPYSQIH